MKTFLMTALLAAVAATAVAPVQAMSLSSGLFDAAMLDAEFDKRRKKRIPGGSGCDDPEDLIEHPECALPV